MDITSVGLQAPLGSAANNASGAVTALQQTNGANNAARNANVATENQPPASTRVTISEEGQARLAAEQAVGAGAQATTIAPTQEPALTPAAQPVAQAAAAAPVETGASAAVGAVGQGVTQAAASAAPVAEPAAAPAATATNAANATATTANTVTGAANTPAQPATPETSTAVRQAVDDDAQQAQVRQSDAAASRQDASPVVAEGANAARSALAA